MIFFHSSSY